MKISDYLPEAIRQAVSDIELIEQGRHPEANAVDMSVWAQVYNGKCEVCLAGATFYREGYNVKDFIGEPGSLYKCDIPDDFKRKALALNGIRSGQIQIALDYWLNQDILDIGSVKIGMYEAPYFSYVLEPGKAKTQWLWTADWLEENVSKKDLTYVGD